MTTLFLALKLLALVATNTPSKCETVGPRLDNTFVTICDGKVTQITDGNNTNNTHQNPFGE